LLYIQYTSRIVIYKHIIMFIYIYNNSRGFLKTCCLGSASPHAAPAPPCCPAAAAAAPAADDDDAVRI
jgi:hypothetical protein